LLNFAKKRARLECVATHALAVVNFHDSAPSHIELRAGGSEMRSAALVARAADRRTRSIVDHYRKNITTIIAACGGFGKRDISSPVLRSLKVEGYSSQNDCVIRRRPTTLRRFD
jgi:hypothetical protein